MSSLSGANFSSKLFKWILCSFDIEGRPPFCSCMHSMCVCVCMLCIKLVTTCTYPNSSTCCPTSIGPGRIKSENSTLQLVTKPFHSHCRKVDNANRISVCNLTNSRSVAYPAHHEQFASTSSGVGREHDSNDRLEHRLSERRSCLLTGIHHIANW